MREEMIRFESYDLQANGVVRPSAIMRRMQQIARDDLNSYGISYDGMRNMNMAFVVSKMALVFERPVRGEIPLKLCSAANPTHGVTFPRSFVLEDEEGVCMRAMSLWALVDFEKRSLLRPSALGEELPTFDDLSGGVVCMRLAKPQFGAAKYSDHRRVYPSMLDQNQHLNNCNYADLATDLLPSGQETVKELHITFQHEVRLGETLFLEGFEEEGGILVSGMNSDQKQSSFLCHIKTF